MTEIKISDLKVVTPASVPAIFVDGPMSIAHIGNIAVLTMSCIRPNPEQAIRAIPNTNPEIEITCRLAMPVDVLKRMADMLKRHDFAVTPVAGSA
jgi:hypothetical protein